MTKGGPITIGDLRREGKRLWIYCLDCCREVETPAAVLSFEDAQPVPTAGQRMKCSRCGSRQVETKRGLTDKTRKLRLESRARKGIAGSFPRNTRKREPACVMGFHRKSSMSLGPLMGNKQT